MKIAEANGNPTIPGKSQLIGTKREIKGCQLTRISQKALFISLFTRALFWPLMLQSARPVARGENAHISIPLVWAF